MRLVYRIYGRPVVLIHTPKSAGKYIQERYGTARSHRIRYVGHARFPPKRLPRRSRLVGLIREPTEWYAANLFFCRREGNFPPDHPIAAYSEGGRLDLPEMLSRMADQEFTERLIASGVAANVYGAEQPGLFEFLYRTGMGFWTWTLMYHYSPLPVNEFEDRADVIAESRRISETVDFIHQERVDLDVQRLLRLPANSDDSVAAKFMPDGDLGAPIDDGARRLAGNLDGDSAWILGGYRLPRSALGTETRKTPNS